MARLRAELAASSETAAALHAALDESRRRQAELEASEAGLASGLAAAHEAQALASQQLAQVRASPYFRGCDLTAFCGCAFLLLR
jgi:hypothetical protein